MYNLQEASYTKSHPGQGGTPMSYYGVTYSGHLHSSNQMNNSDANNTLVFACSKGWDATLGMNVPQTITMQDGANLNSTIISLSPLKVTNGKNMLLSQLGSDVFKFAVSTVPKTIFELLDKAGVTADDIDLFVCHQANMRIIESVAKKCKQSLDKFFVNLDEYGNTSSASIPIALSELNQKGMLKPGMKIICVGFGGGLTWGGAYIEW